MKNGYQDSSHFLHELLVMGEMMQACGAEVFRVEDTLNRMGAAYGAEQMNVFVITSSIVITMELPDGQELTQTRRIRKAGENDFLKLEQLNALSREYCAAPFAYDILRRRLDEIQKNQLSVWNRYWGSILVAASFTMFFGGSAADAGISALFAVFICWMQEHAASVCMNAMIFNIVVSFLTGLGICSISRLFSVLHRDMVMIGDIMLVIPGIAITNAVRDVLIGDTISGIMRFIEAMLWAGCLAFGFMGAIWLIGIL